MIVRKKNLLLIIFFELLLFCYPVHLISANTKIDSPTPTPNSSSSSNMIDLLDKAKALYFIGDYPNALSKYFQILNLSKEINDKEGEAIAFHNIGLIYRVTRDFDQALLYYQQALTIYREINNPNIVNTLFDIGKLFDSMQDYDQALYFCSQALKLSRETRQTNREVFIINRIGSIYHDLNNYEEAINYYNKALSISQEFGIQNAEAIILTNRGVAYESKCLYSKARDDYRHALEIYQEIGDLHGEALILNNLGTISILINDYEQALLFLQDSYNVSVKNGDKLSQGRSIFRIGAIFDILHDYEKAHPLYMKALNIFRETREFDDLAKTLNHLGGLYLKIGDYEQALISFEEALGFGQDIINKTIDSTTLYNLSALFYEIGNYKRALNYVEQSLTNSLKNNDISGEAYALHLKGILFFHMNSYQSAYDQFQQSLIISQNSNQKTLEFDNLEYIGLFHLLLNNKTDALEYFLLAIEVGENIRSAAKLESFQIALASQDVDAYQSAIQLLVEMGRNEEAFNLTERSRARAFLDAMGNNRPDLHQGTDATLLEQEQALNGELAALENALISEKSKPIDQQNIQVLDSIESQLADKYREYEDLLLLIELNNPELASLVSVSSITVSETQSLLDDQSTLIAYYLTNDNVFAFVLSKNDFQVVELTTNPNEITQAVKNFRSIGLANRNNPYNRSLTDLYGWLITPLLPHISTPRIGIIPHQALHYIPFAALSDGKQYLGDQFILFQLPSASVLPFIREKIGREVTHPLIMGDPQTNNTSLPSLKYASDEVNAIAELFGTEALIGAKASESVLMENSSNAGVIHLAAHGSFNSNAPLFSRLWLAPGDGQDGRLNVHEIYGLDLDQTDLVVLSACQTQLGELSGGDELVGLNRAFLFGSPSVISSLWSVDDKATAVLMEHFYSNLLAGMSKAEALQAAQQYVRNDPEHPDWVHPFFWAGFVLNGDDGISSSGVNPTPMPSKNNLLVPSIGVSVLIVVATLVYLIVIKKKSTS